MVLGAVYCRLKRRKKFLKDYIVLKSNIILFLKIKRMIMKIVLTMNLKWNKVSKSKIEYYKDVINYFFDDDDLQFRTLVVSNKSANNYEKFNHTHDTFYYKMYFGMLKAILNPENSHHIYIDIKDTRSKEKFISWNRF
jgi:hypothetical protein